MNNVNKYGKKETKEKEWACHLCDKKGHVIRDCPSLAKARQFLKSKKRGQSLAKGSKKAMPKGEARRKRKLNTEQAQSVQSDVLTTSSVSDFSELN